VPKDQGGLGILNLELQNECLLSKWLFKLINEDGVWQELLRKKYLKDKTIGEAYWKPGDSHFLSGLMKIKDRFLGLSTFVLHNGTSTWFWKDKWLGDCTLKQQFPSWYNIARKKHATVSQVFSSVPLNISFCRALVGDKLTKWNELGAKVVFVQLEDQPDTLKWNLTRHDVFTVQSMYNYYIHSNFVPTNKHMWKLKLPLKIKVFVWFLIKGVILIKDNLVKRNWIGSERCCFCNNNETIQHLLFDCHVSHFIWRLFMLLLV